MGKATTVALILSPCTVGALDDVPAAASVADRAAAMGLSGDLEGAPMVVEDVDYALQMEATLAGLDFDVDPAGPQRKLVLPGKAAQWSWSVAPKQPGKDIVLTLAVNAIVERDGEALPPVEVRTFSEKILVTVSGWERTIALAKQASVLHRTIIAVGKSCWRC